LERARGAFNLGGDGDVPAKTAGRRRLDAMELGLHQNTSQNVRYCSKLAFARLESETVRHAVQSYARVVGVGVWGACRVCRPVWHGACVCVSAWGQHVCVCECGCAWRQGHAHDGTKSDGSRPCAREHAKWRALAGRLGRLCRQIGARRGPRRPIQMSASCRVEEIYRVLGVLTCHASRPKGAKGAEAVMRLVPAPVILCMLPQIQPNLCSTVTQVPCALQVSVIGVRYLRTSLHTATAADHSPHASPRPLKKGCTGRRAHDYCRAHTH
jgi:hypothetical protein